MEGEGGKRSHTGSGVETLTAAWLAEQFPEKKKSDRKVEGVNVELESK